MDGIHMDPGATIGAMESMSRTGDQLSTDWGAINGRLTALAGRLGQGELGQAYLAAYRQPAADTAAAVDDHCQHPGRLAGVGHQCVDLYRSADQNSAGNFNAV